MNMDNNGEIHGTPQEFAVLLSEMSVEKKTLTMTPVIQQELRTLGRMKKRGRWTMAQQGRLRRMMKTKMTHAEMAKELGCPVRRVTNKIFVLRKIHMSSDY